MSPLCIRRRLLFSRNFMPRSSKNFLLLALLSCPILYGMQNTSSTLAQSKALDQNYSFDQRVFPPSKERSQIVIRMVEHVHKLENGIKTHVGQIAFALFTETRRGIISNLRVEKEFQDKGCGSRLLRDACKKLQEMGSTRICLTAISEELHDQGKLVAFYQHRSFKHDETDRASILFGLSMYKEVSQPQQPVNNPTFTPIE